MSYIILTRWTPRSIDSASPGWLTLPQVHSISENAEYARQVLSSSTKDDLEIQAICVNYINGCLFLRNVIGEESIIKSYQRKSQSKDLVFTMMLVSSEEDWNSGVEGQDWYSYYTSARNNLLDLLDVKMEVKKFVSTNPTEWEILNSSELSNLGLIFENTDGKFTSYP